MTIVKHTHSKECSDYKAAAEDRKKHAVAAKAFELRQQVLAKARWFGADLRG